MSERKPRLWVVEMKVGKYQWEVMPSTARLTCVQALEYQRNLRAQCSADTRFRCVPYERAER